MVKYDDKPSKSLTRMGDCHEVIFIVRNLRRFESSELEEALSKHAKLDPDLDGFTIVENDVVTLETGEDSIIETDLMPALDWIRQRPRSQSVPMGMPRSPRSERTQSVFNPEKNCAEINISHQRDGRPWLKTRVSPQMPKTSLKLGRRNNSFVVHNNTQLPQKVENTTNGITIEDTKQLAIEKDEHGSHTLEENKANLIAEQNTNLANLGTHNFPETPCSSSSLGGSTQEFTHSEQNTIAQDNPK